MHDFPGHAFPVQLSRALALRGHEVLHLTFGAFQSPKGPLEPKDCDPPSFSLATVDLGEPFAKYDLMRRSVQERRYGVRLVEIARRFAPEVVIGGNAPLDPQAMLLAFAKRSRAGFLFWLQDVYGVAIDAILRRRFPGLGHVAGWWYRRLERNLWRESDMVVPITQDFAPLLNRQGVPDHRIAVVENWANLEDFPVLARDTPWRRENALGDAIVLLYSGTLGLKHNPNLLVQVARRFRERPDVRVVLVSEGIGADEVAKAKHQERLDNLVILPFQPHDRLREVLASGDALTVLLEPDAGIYSVPSKTLSYLCAGRAILGAIPSENLAARLIRREGAGLVAEPADHQAFMEAAHALVVDPARRDAMGRAGRAYAEAHFDIGRITDRFEDLLIRVRDHAK
jgi:glycosyltransferase involved in cell wall biosynthesis